jgi:hypothetical protein
MLPVLVIGQFHSLALHFKGEHNGLLAGKYCHAGEHIVVGLSSWYSFSNPHEYITVAAHVHGPTFFSPKLQ